MRRILPCLLLLWATSLNAAPLITTVAMVNNDVVTSYQLEKNLATATGQRQLSPEEQSTLRLKVLNGMIEELLVEQRIRELGLSVSAQELNSAIEDVQRQNKLTREQLKTALDAQGMSFSDYQKNLRKEILRYKLIAREVRSKVEVTKAEIREYFNAHQAEYMSLPTLRLGRISYPLAEDSDEKSKEQFIQQAQVARQQLLDGKPFAEVLSSLGGDVEGGDMGTMIEEEMNPTLQEMIEGLTVGQVNQPTEALGSIHIFQVLERTPAKAELDAQISSTIEKILAEQNSEKRFNEWKKELRKDAVVDIRI
jgi:peptidyl-prolyl cis-trans isomerase SurA